MPSVLRAVLAECDFRRGRVEKYRAEIVRALRRWRGCSREIAGRRRSELGFPI